MCATKCVYFQFASDGCSSSSVQCRYTRQFSAAGNVEQQLDEIKAMLVKGEITRLSNDAESSCSRRSEMSKLTIGEVADVLNAEK